MTSSGEILKSSGENAKNYTIPIIQFGKKCSGKVEQAKQKWLVEFEIDGKRKRLSGKLNNISSYSEKLKAFIQLRDEIEEALINGTYGNDASLKKPINKAIEVIPTNVLPVQVIDDIDENDNTDALLVTNVIKEYIVNVRNRGLRDKTVRNYEYSLKYLDAEYGNRLISQIYHKDIQDILNKGVNIKGWSNRTFNLEKTIVNSFFAFAIDCRYITENPLKRIKSRYSTKSDNNKAFSKEDFTLIIKAIEPNKVLSMMVKSIYYTCIRPKELLTLQWKHFDLERRTIFIPAHISKNKRDGYVHIDDAYYNDLIKHYKDAPPEAYLFCNRKTLWGFKPYQKNTPYFQLFCVLKELGLDNKGYTMYSTKHYSNIQRFLGGWKIAEIMKANRHASIQQTENYLRHLVDYVDVTKKEIPTL